MLAKLTRTIDRLLGPAFMTVKSWLSHPGSVDIGGNENLSVNSLNTSSSMRPIRDEPDDPVELIEKMLREGRHCLLLKPQIVGNLTPNQRVRAKTALLHQMTEIGSGPVVVLEVAAALGDIDGSAEDHGSSVAEATIVDAYYLDRHPVTNQEFLQFVEAGGYQESEIWDTEVWPVVADFVDRTGLQGPRFWVEGHCPAGMENHPVVGVSWYEAIAYARWLGKRLPTDVEWVKLPVLRSYFQEASSASDLPVGRYHRSQPNQSLGNRSGGNGPVTDFASGDTPSGIRQLIGNVWEWTSADLDREAWERLWPDGSLRSTAMKALRGGAYDTYFDVQATCQFQSGDHPLVANTILVFAAQ